MKRFEKRLEPQRIILGQRNGNAGLATGCLVSVIVVILMLVAGGVYVVKNYQSWLAHGITAGMHALINTSDLPQQEKSEINDIIDQLKAGYLAEEISFSELGLILENISHCPAIPIGLVIQFEESYVTPSGLRPYEKSAANRNLNRLARGISGGQIGWETIEDILAPISKPGEDGNQQLMAPAEVSDNDIRQVLAEVQKVADLAAITDEKIEIDISNEFKKSIEIALGRSLD